MTNLTQDNPLVRDFIAFFQSLSEAEQFKLGATFNAATGGKLSPFNSPSPVSVIVAPVETPEGLRVLGLRRAIEPHIGRVALPGGFVQPNEEPAEAAVRELLEETGLRVSANDFEATCHSRAAGGNNSLLFFRLAKPITQEQFDQACVELEAKGDGEAFELILLDRDTPLAFPLHEEALRLSLIHI